MAAGLVSLEIIGNWTKEAGVTMAQALSVSMDVTGDSGEKACRKALWFMGQAAGKIAGRTARKKKRSIQRDEHGKFVDVYVQGKRDHYKLYPWMFENEGGILPGLWENAKKIGNKGLAKRSWMWGLNRFKKSGGKSSGAPIPGTSRVSTIRGTNINGYIKDNKLSYILKAMGPGWERKVEVSAGNRIMAQARNKLEAKWRREVGAEKGMKLSNRSLASYFKAAQ